MTVLLDNRSKPVALAAVAAVSVAVLGGLMTDVGTWYASLQKPSWQPPDWAFAPAWTLIFALTAAAGLRAWLGSDTRIGRQNLLLVLSANAALNVLWSLMFFRLRRPDWALFEVVFFWLSIVALIVVCSRRDSVAAWLVVPYLVWVSFAALINYSVVQLNAPFGYG